MERGGADTNGSCLGERASSCMEGRKRDTRCHFLGTNRKRRAGILVGESHHDTGNDRFDAAVHRGQG